MLEVGLHLDNRVAPTARDLELAGWLGGGLKFMDNLGPEEIAGLIERFGPDRHYCYRPYFAPPRHLEGLAFDLDGSAPPSLERYHADWRGEVRAKLRALFAALDRRGLQLARPLVVQVYNEPNLPRGTPSWEGFGQTLGDMRAYDRLLVQAADEIEGEFGARVVVGWGPLAIGNRDVWCPGDPDDHVYYHEVCWRSLGRLRAYLANLYPTVDAPPDERGADGVVSEYWGLRHRRYLAAHPNPSLPVFVVEGAVQDLERSAAFAASERRGRETVRWLEALSSEPNVRAVFLWIGGDLDEPRRDRAFDFARFYAGSTWRPVALQLRAWAARGPQRDPGRAGVPTSRPAPTPTEPESPAPELSGRVELLERQMGLLVAGLAETVRQQPSLLGPLWPYLAAISPPLASEQAAGLEGTGTHEVAPESTGTQEAALEEDASPSPLLTRFGECPAVVAAAIRAAWPSSLWVAAAEVAYLESGWNARARADTLSLGPCGTPYTLPDGRPAMTEDSRGLFQINVCVWPEPYPDAWYDPAENAAQAYRIFERQGWGAWYYSAERLGLR